MSDWLWAENISLKAGNRLLLDRITIELNPGELVALIGPNGAGKSTLLRTLTGFQPPTTGQVALQGKSLTHWSEQALSRLRAVMRQQSPLAFSWSVEEVVALGRAPWPDILTESLVDDVLRLTGCIELKGREFCHLSGGEQQRVQLARSLVQLWRDGMPRGWLFLDEPTSALDLHHQQQTLRLLKQRVSQGALSVCAVLHDLNLAALWADRVILLHQGRIVAQGSAEEVLNQQTLQRWYRADLRVFPHPESAAPCITLRQ